MGEQNEAGWVDATRPEAQRWLNKEDMGKGQVWQGKLADVLLVAGDEGEYRVGYVLALTKPGRLPDDVPGAAIIIGEKAQLQQLRERAFGDEVRLTILGEKGLPGGRRMLQFGVQFKPGDGKQGTVAQRLKTLWASIREATSGDGLPF